MVVSEEHLEIREGEKTVRQIHFSHVNNVVVLPMKKNQECHPVRIRFNSMETMVVSASANEFPIFIEAFEAKLGRKLTDSQAHNSL